MKIKILLVLAILGFASCREFLDATIYSSIEAEQMFQDYENADMAVQGVYSSLTTRNGYGLAIQAICSYGTDEARCYFATNASVNGYFYRISNYSHSAADVPITSMWNNLYKGIASANDVFHKVERMTNISREQKNQLQAEVSFLRGYYYFIIVQLWGPARLTTEEPNKTNALNTNVTRASVKKIYEQIIEDLNFAKEWLPDAWSASYAGRVTKYSAYGMLSKVYLTMASGARFGVAGYDEFDSIQYYSQAKEEADIVVYDRLHVGNAPMLLSDYSQIFSIHNKHNREILFEANFAVGGPTSIWGKLGGPGKKATASDEYKFQNYGEVGRSYVRPTAYLSLYIYGNEHSVVDGSLMAAQSDDIRFENNIVPYQLERVDAQGNRTWGDVRKDPTFWEAYKFSLKQAAMDGFTWNNTPMNQPILRFAEVLLIHSEAAGMLNLNDPEAYYGINKVRARARRNGTDPEYLKDYSVASFKNEYEFLDAVLDERMRELCFEGQRRQDLLRTARLHKAIKQMERIDRELSSLYGDTSGVLSKNAIKSDITNQRFDINLQPYHILLPIPQSEMNIVSNPDYKQNPGWVAVAIEDDDVNEGA